LPPRASDPSKGVCFGYDVAGARYSGLNWLLHTEGRPVVTSKPALGTRETLDFDVSKFPKKLEPLMLDRFASILLETCNQNSTAADPKMQTNATHFKISHLFR
jgi:hypothetical protein